MAIYNSFRFLISEQPSLFQPDRDKKEIFKEVLLTLVGQQKEEYIHNGNKHIFYFLAEPSPEVYIFQFAREERYNTPREVDNKIQVVVDYRLPNVIIIIDWKRQIILIENKPSVFQMIEITVARLESYFERKILARTATNYKFSLSAISREVDFWNEVNSAERIYSLELSFNPPNLFEGRHEANELVEEAYEATNFSQFKLKFINTKGKLKLLEENLHNFINLIASGAGNYVVKMVKFKGKKRESRKINSLYFASQQTLPDDIEYFTEKMLDDKLEKIDKLNENHKSLSQGAESKTGKFLSSATRLMSEPTKEKADDTSETIKPTEPKDSEHKQTKKDEL